MLWFLRGWHRRRCLWFLNGGDFTFCRVNCLEKVEEVEGAEGKKAPFATKVIAIH